MCEILRFMLSQKSTLCNRPTAKDAFSKKLLPATNTYLHTNATYSDLVALVPSAESANR